MRLIIRNELRAAGLLADKGRHVFTTNMEADQCLHR
jgi:hypothetical protein